MDGPSSQQFCSYFKHWMRKIFILNFMNTFIAYYIIVYIDLNSMISYRQIGKFEYYKHLINILKSKHILTIYFQTGREEITVKNVVCFNGGGHKRTNSFWGKMGKDPTPCNVYWRTNLRNETLMWFLCMIYWPRACVAQCLVPGMNVNIKVNSMSIEHTMHCWEQNKATPK